ncbi:unnamed protein product [marine sediment metagenome]|uniref:Uncharacterized protein n=1 Tax=marine sediment metagenome TaxID=412755 RepID=X0XQM5_9ZZZZ
MQTTSLEMSRALQEAGYTESREDTRAWWTPEGSLTEFPYPTCVPAYTLLNLVPALGLDKPWDDLDAFPYDRGEEGYGWSLSEVACGAIYEHGLTPDTLAQVWLDEHAKEKK